MPANLPRLVLAGTASGVGKTTLTAAIIAALAARGLQVAPFKVGPDYLDPTYHSLAAGRPCRNLDSWLVPPETLRGLFGHAAKGADCAAIEGVMGLYDGRDGAGEAGSSAEVAKLLRAPIVLVLDVSKQARSAAAVARGFQTFDPAAPIRAFLLNRVGSPRHAALARREIEAATGLPVLGALPRTAEIELPSRHLGLVPSEQQERAGQVVARLAELAEQHFDLSGLLELARAAGPLPVGRSPLPDAPSREPPVGLAVARDAAFSFYYQDNLDLLAAHGARLLPFSPLHDEALPTAAAGLYLGGGYPELFAAQLAANRSMLDSVRRAAAAGLPIYAECGGLMYLARGLVDAAGQRHALTGLLPCSVAMAARRTALGYVELRALESSLLCQAGQGLRGHEFHWSRLIDGADQANAYELLAPAPRREGFVRDNLLASYVHLHFASQPDLARRFVASLR